MTPWLTHTNEAPLPLMPNSMRQSSAWGGHSVCPELLRVAKENQMASKPPLRSLHIGKDLEQLIRTVAVKASLQDMFNQQDGEL